MSIAKATAALLVAVLALVAAGFGAGRVSAPPPPKQVTPDYASVAHHAVDLYVALTSQHYPVADLEYIGQTPRHFRYTVQYSDGSNQDWVVVTSGKDVAQGARALDKASKPQVS